MPRFIGDTVYLLDLDSPARQTLVRSIAEAGYEVVAHDSIMAFLANVRVSGSAACAVIDLEMPGLDGVEILGHMRSAGNEIPAIFLTAGGDIAACVRAMRAGAIDYLAKPVREEALIDAILRAQSKSAELYRARTTALLLRERVIRLTAREREVLSMVLRGMLNKQISFALACGEATVKVHRSRLMRKLNMRSLAELLMFTQQLDAALRVTCRPAPPSDRDVYAVEPVARPQVMRAAATPFN